MRRQLDHSLGLALAIWMAGSGPLAAQQDAGAVKHQNDCRLAAQVLTDGQPANKRDWALGIIQSCPQADDVVPLLWTELPTTEEEIEGLFHVSRQIRDGRIYEAAYSVASDPVHSPVVRIVALGVLGSYITPDLHLHLPLKPAAVPEPLRYDNMWSGIDHWTQREGKAPVPAGAQESIRALVAELADPESAAARAPEVFAAAWWLQPRIRER